MRFLILFAFLTLSTITIQAHPQELNGPFNSSVE
jgi:hypothetical protein